MDLVNPLKPTAGMTPPVLIGREAVIEDFRDGIEEGAGAPGRLMRITGPRGSGKTVLLTRAGRARRTARLECGQRCFGRGCARFDSSPAA